VRRTALIVFAAALVAGVALTAARSLSGGFDRAADRADLPDLIVRFDREERADVEERLGALPNVAQRAYRLELNDVAMVTDGGRSRRGALHIVDGGRRATTSSRAATCASPARSSSSAASPRSGTSPPATVCGSRGSAPRRSSPASRSRRTTSRSPLAAAPRMYLHARDVGTDQYPVNIALAWLQDRSRQDVTLTQARAVSFGLTDLQFVTRAGVQVLIGQAAGIVIALLVAFSVVAVGASTVMLGASARSEVARRLPAIGVERALGFSRGAIARRQALRGALVAAPAAALGLLAGWLAVRGPSERLLVALNEVGPGAGLAPWLVGAWLVIVGLVAAASAWPAFRATAGPVAGLLRGGELAAGGSGAAAARAGAASPRSAPGSA
jgi:hypothetical protein